MYGGALFFSMDYLFDFWGRTVYQKTALRTTIQSYGFSGSIVFVVRDKCGVCVFVCVCVCLGVSQGMLPRCVESSLSLLRLRSSINVVFKIWVASRSINM